MGGDSRTPPSFSRGAGLRLRGAVVAVGLAACGCTVYPEGQPDEPPTSAAAAAWARTHSDSQCIEDCLADATQRDVCEERCNK